MTASLTSPTLVRVGDENQAFGETRLRDPCGAGHLSIAVLGEVSGEHGSRIRGAAGQDRGDSGPILYALLEFAFSGNQVSVSGRDAGEIRDCVLTAGCSVNSHLKITRCGV
jgi:hypothetical protein